MTAVRDDKGTSTLEMSILAPVLLLLTFIPIQVGFWLQAAQVAQAAARHGVTVTQAEGATEADGIAAVEAFLAAAGTLANSTVTVTRTSSTVTVEVTGQPPLLLPVRDWTIHVRAEGSTERFIREPDR